MKPRRPISPDPRLALAEEVGEQRPRGCLGLTGARWLLAGCLVAVAVAGLYTPADSGADQVRWCDETRTTAFARSGAVHGPIPAAPNGIGRLNITVDFVPVHPRHGAFGVLMQIDSNLNRQPLIIGQWKDRLIAMRGTDFAGSEGRPRLIAHLDEMLGHRTRLEFDVGPSGTRLRLNDRHVGTLPAGVQAYDGSFDRITLGNTPSGGHGWRGSLYRVRLAGAVSDGGQGWRRDFRFDEDRLPIIRDASDDAVHLAVPPTGRFPDLRPFSTLEWQHLFGAPRDVLLNLAGFIPLGFAAAGALTGPRGRRWIGIAAALVIGITASVMIEALQRGIPGRHPHAHDLVLNSVGTAIGVLLFTMHVRWRSAGRTDPTP